MISTILLKCKDSKFKLPFIYYIDSDLLFSAIVNNLANIGYDVNEIANHFKVTSAYPYINEPFLPITGAVFKDIVRSEERESLRKKIKRIQFASLDVLANKGKYDVSDVFLVREGEDASNFFSRGTKVSVSLMLKEKNLYYDEYLQVKNAGFWFKIEYDEVYKKELSKALELIKHNGIGGDRNIGYGKIDEVKRIDNFNINLNLGNWKYLLLSLVFPNNEDIPKLSDNFWVVRKIKFFDSYKKVYYFIRDGIYSKEKFMEGKLLFDGKKIIYGKAWWEEI